MLAPHIKVFEILGQSVDCTHGNTPPSVPVNSWPCGHAALHAHNTRTRPTTKRIPTCVALLLGLPERNASREVLLFGAEAFARMGFYG